MWLNGFCAYGYACYFFLSFALNLLSTASETSPNSYDHAIIFSVNNEDAQCLKCGCLSPACIFSSALRCLLWLIACWGRTWHVAASYLHVAPDCTFVCEDLLSHIFLFACCKHKVWSVETACLHLLVCTCMFGSGLLHSSVVVMAPGIWFHGEEIQRNEKLSLFKLPLSPHVVFLKTLWNQNYLTVTKSSVALSHCPLC